MRKLLSLLLLLPLGLSAQDLAPVAELDTQAIRIGEQTRLKLSVNYRVDKGERVQIVWPVITGDTITSHIEVLEDSGVDTVVISIKNAVLGMDPAAQQGTIGADAGPARDAGAFAPARL